MNELRGVGERPKAHFLTRTCGLLVTVVAACSTTTAKHVRGPDGRDDWVVITCKGSEGNCFERAGQECTKGYDIGDKGGVTGEYQDVASGFTVPTYTGELLVKCH
jgi:hypothetical protein